MDYNKARYNMVKQQVQTWGVTDPHVLDLMSTLPRERFVPEAYKELAYSDTMVPLQHGQVMLQPKTVGRILQCLAIKPDEKVLEIGTGTGYLTALLSQLTQNLHSVEIFPDLSAQAGENLAKLNINSVDLAVGDAAKGWDGDSLYDVIIITGALTCLPLEYKLKLSLGGRLFAFVGESPNMEATLLTCHNPHDWQAKFLFESDVPLLVNAPQKEAFTF